MRALLLSAALAGAASSVASQRPAIALAPCSLPGVTAPARCGTFPVPENRAAPHGRQITLKVVVLPAEGRAQSRDAFTYFEGGPGGAAIPDAGDLLEQFAGVHRRVDMVLVDQRGTGESSPLLCHVFGGIDSLQGWLGSFLPIEGVKRCRDDLAGHADLTQYTTDAHADDIDDVRAALGYDKLDIVGGSYGTRAALVYLKRHPAHVRSVVISGILPTTEAAPEGFARDAESALRGVFEECRADAACQGAFPNVGEELARVVRELARAPVRVQVIHPTSGEVVDVSLTRDLFGEALRYMLYSSRSASMIPAIVHAAALGDFGPIADRAVFYRARLVGDSDTGLYLSVTCDEDLPYVDHAKSERMGEGTFLGNYRLREQSAACAIWPHKDILLIDPDFREPTRSGVPVLLFSGERDPVTPATSGALAARTLSNSVHLIVRSGGHGYAGLVGAECVDALAERFLERPDPKALDTSCMAAVRRAPFPVELHWSNPIVLEPAALQRFTGRYGGGGHGPAASVRLEGGRLHLEIQGNDMLLVPVGPATFRAAGRSRTIEFRLAGTRVQRLVVLQDGVETLSLEPAG